MTDEQIETLKDILPRIKSDCDHVRYSCEEIGCWNGPLEKALRALLAERDRLREEIERLNAEVNYLRLFRQSAQDWKARVMNLKHAMVEIEKFNKARVKDLESSLDRLRERLRDHDSARQTLWASMLKSSARIRYLEARIKAALEIAMEPYDPDSAGVWSDAALLRKRIVEALRGERPAEEESE